MTNRDGWPAQPSALCPLPSVIRGAVVVTGASSGIGRATALGLARQGWWVFGGVRAEADAVALVAAAGAVGLGALLHPLLLDVTDTASIAAAVVTVRDALAGRDLLLIGLVNNAGIAVAGPIEEVPLDRLRAGLAVNVVGVVAVTQAFLPLLRAGKGRIINVGSVAGRVAAPFLGAYSATKFALEALSDALRVELRPWGLAVVLIEPGPIATPIWAKGAAGALADRAELASDSPYAPYAPRVQAFARHANATGLPPGRVAKSIAHALAVPRPRARYVVARNRIAFALLVRLVPDSLRDAFLSRNR